MKLRVKIDDTFYEVEIENVTTRPVIARVDGETFEVYPEEAAGPTPAAAVQEVPSLSAQPHPPAAPITPPQAAAAPTGGKAVPAPIPGVILSISVKVGEEVSIGQELCILEAMKMNNAIRANRAGKIGAIHVTPGDHVTHNQLLMEFTD